MKILIYMGDFYNVDGPYAVRMRIFKEIFEQKGFEVELFSPDRKELSSLCGIKSIDDWYEKLGTVKKTAFSRGFKQLAYGVKSLLLGLKMKDIDIVLVTSPPILISPFGYLIARKHNAKLVYDVRDIWPDVALEIGAFTEKSFYYKIFDRIKRLMMKKSDLVIAVTKGKVRKLKQQFPDRDVRFVSNGIDEGFLDYQLDDNFVKQYGLDCGFNVVYVGNIGFAQGLTQFLRLAEYTLNLFPDVHYLIFGSGVEQDKIEKYIREHGLSNVRLVGRIPRSQVYTVFFKGSLAYIPLVSSNLYDSIPTKLYEVMSVGCPVLVSAAGDSAELVNEYKGGIVVAPENYIALYNAFDKLYRNIEEYRKAADPDYIINTYSRQKISAEFAELLINELV